MRTYGGNHRKPPILDFVNLVLLEGGGILAHSKGIKSKVSGLPLSVHRLLQRVTRDSLKNNDSHHNLDHAPGLDVGVVRGDGQHLREVRTAERKLLLYEHAEAVARENVTRLRGVRY